MTDASEFFTAAFASRRIMGVFRGLSAANAVRRAQRAWDLGLDHVEITLESPAGVATLRAVVEAARERGKIVGAGTVTTAADVDAALDAGATYTVAPGWDPVVAGASIEAGLPHLPGTATATEIQDARSHGLTWSKAFPATALTASWLTAMHGPFPNHRFVATGGITSRNAAAFLAAGASVVAVGAALDDDDSVRQLSALL